MAERAKNKFYVKRAVIHGAKIWFAAENKFFGPGAARFLALVEKMGTINEACDEMKLSYNKARKIVRTMERELGSKVFTINRSYENWKGSTGTGGAIMTDEWKELVRRYEAMKAECDAFVKESYDRNFDGFLEPRVPGGGVPPA